MKTSAAAIGAVLLLALATPLVGQTTRHEFSVGPEYVAFQSDEGNVSALAGKASGSLLWTDRLGENLAVAIEPRGGLRAFAFQYTTSEELAAEVTETLASTSAIQRVRWQLMAQQKGRLLSETPTLPAYLEPTRFETWINGRLAVRLAGRWELEGQGSGGLVRYGPAEWKVLNRNGAEGSLGLLHPLASGMLRVAAATGVYGFVDETALDRNDRRSELRADWTVSGALLMQVSAGVAWNSSSLPGFDFNSQRGALMLSLPMGSGSAQLYAAFARKSYENPGSADARVAPSDQDTGSLVVLQVTRPLASGNVIRLRGEWSRSETGFRNVFFQRLGFAALYSIRVAGGTQG
jgi:hypothetical protein